MIKIKKIINFFLVFLRKNIFILKILKFFTIELFTNKLRLYLKSFRCKCMEEDFFKADFLGILKKITKNLSSSSFFKQLTSNFQEMFLALIIKILL